MLTRMTIEEKEGGQVSYSIEQAPKSKEDFIAFLGRFQPQAEKYGLRIVFQELPPTKQVVDLL